MGLDFETRHLILAVHLFVGVLFLTLAGVLLMGGRTTAGLIRAGVGTAIVFAGFYFFRLRS